MEMPGPGYAFFGPEERANVEEVLDHWERTRHTYGRPEPASFVHRFEALAGEVFGARHAVTTNSGTSALLTALVAAGIGAGDEVIVPGYTFVASIASVAHLGAVPVLAEIDESLTLDPADVERRITPRTRAVMAVHMLGAPCDLTALRRVTERHGLLLVEDVAQACGGTYEGRALGTFGGLGAFSLNPYKVLTSGDGGFVLTDDPGLHRRAAAFKDHGRYPADGPAGDPLFGLNLRMPELSAAVACAQLAKLDSVLRRTRAVKRRLAAAIPAREGVRRRTLHDAAGECGTLLVHLFDRAGDARAVASALGTTTLRDSGQHYYGNMRQLTAPGGRYAGPALRPGALPRTDDCLARAVALSVGVSDRHLGAGFGTTVHASDTEIDWVAERFTKAVRGVLG
ncbi:8-amino-3,8-dideoxy-alpha-D-manno-octulosonate transaminase [Streptomyces griseoviridis]|uniref:8-amino-3,8-dideoxy-alpha-D-manno-octulosonate transaminase n=2 Tax=Streptomyces griseoviridis TaxID=45398 RepID=A0A918GK97_STRGD|nr:8-amino-3,8-dideoxy-alpha-D-manno-octulosonate transaminase [Streptomyces niveoruber]